MDPAVPNLLSHLRVKHLLLLDYIDQEGSLRKVAARLGLTQPAITAMLHDLEDALQGELVRRGRQGARLTAAGFAARDRLRVVLHTLHSVRLANGVSPSGRLIRVAALPVAMFEIGPMVIAALADVAPDLRVQFVERNVESALSDLHEGRIDCAIARVDSAVLAGYPSEAFSFRPLVPMHLQVVCGRQHPLFGRRGRGRRPIDLAQLAQEQWTLLGPDSQLRMAFDQAFVEAGISPPTPVIESLSFASSLLIAARSRLLTIAPASSLTRIGALGSLDRIDFRWPVALSPLMLVWRKDMGPLPDMALLTDLLQRTFEQAVSDRRAGRPAATGRRRRVRTVARARSSAPRGSRSRRRGRPGSPSSGRAAGSRVRPPAA